MSFKDFDELVAPSVKALPIGGKLYEFPDRVSAKTGLLMLRLQRHRAEGVTDEATLVAKTGLTPEDLGAITDELLGDTVAELVSDGKGGAIGRVISALTAWHLYGQEAAERTWNQVDPTTAPNRAARRTSKATGTSSPRRASTAGTTARRKPPARS